MLIEWHDINRVYRTKNVQTRALNDVNLKIDTGEFVAIMGPSGCGKSTLLNILGMLDSPSSGSYKFQDDEIAHSSEKQLAKLRKDNVGFIFQNFNLIDELNVKRNIGLSLLYHRISRAERKQRVSEVMERLDITHRSEHMPKELSGGQQQRVAVARAMVSNPKIVLADEPTGNLDSAHGEEVMNMIRELNDQGSTVVMVTHSNDYAQYAHRVVELFDGKIVPENTDKNKELEEARA
jgi:putative ABC transport system ATP-binding protein